MSSDNVIRPVFGGRKTEVIADQASNSEAAPISTEAPDFEQDIDYFLAKLERAWEAHMRGDEMTNYLFDDVGYNKNDGSLQLRRPVVSTYSFEQFCDRLLGSSRSEWRAQPAFYGALFIEFHERQNFILMALEGRKEQVQALAEGDRKIILQIAVRAEL